jgi:hypothetical protein
MGRGSANLRGHEDRWLSVLNPVKSLGAWRVSGDRRAESHPSPDQITAPVPHVVGESWNFLTLTLGGLLSFLLMAVVATHAGETGFASAFTHGKQPQHFDLLPVLRERSWWLYSAWYYLQGLVVGPSPSHQLLINSGFLLVGALSMAKGAVLTGICMASGFRRLWSLLFGFMLGAAIAFPVAQDWGSPYIGTIPPNVFMSATQLLANTGAVLCVFGLTIWLKNPHRGTLWLASVTAMVSAVAKPALTPAFLAVLGLLAVYQVLTHRMRVRPAITDALIIGVIPAVTVVLGWLPNYYGQDAPFKTVWAPGATWAAFHKMSSSQFSPGFVSIGFDLLRSVAFPLAVVAALAIGRRLSKDTLRTLVPAWLIFLVATVIFALLGEATAKGKLFFAGNFMWGAVAASAALYVMSLIALRGVPLKITAVPLLVLLVQCFGTWLYFQHWLDTGTFL